MDGSFFTFVLYYGYSMVKARHGIAGLLIGLFFLGALVQFCTHGMMQMVFVDEMLRAGPMVGHEQLSLLCTDGTCAWSMFSTPSVVPFGVVLLVVCVFLGIALLLFVSPRFSLHVGQYVYVPPWRSGGRFALRE